MRKFVINLDRCPDCLTMFRSRNRHVEGIERFTALDGRSLIKEELLRKNIVGEAHGYSMNAIGSALSHMTLWERSIAEDRTLCIMEDDAILSLNFDHHLGDLTKMKAHWDYVAWGWNFDAPLHIALLPGVFLAQILASQSHFMRNVEAFGAAKFNVTFYRLIKYYGIRL